MFRNREARSGFTLTEVLMAMFVMAIGMISLLALFPVAFQNAKWALDNEQVSRAAANSQVQTETPRVSINMTTGIVSTTQQSMRNDAAYNPDMSNNYMLWKIPNALTSSLGRRDFLVDMNMTPNQWTFDWNVNQIGPAPILNAKVQLPPVFVDPQIADSPVFRETTNTGLVDGLPYHVGVLPNTPAALLPFSAVAINPADPATLRPRKSLGIPRGSMSQYSMVMNPMEMAGSGWKMRLQNEFSQGDEIDFGRNGQPIVNGTFYGRQRRFTWAYMCHWPDYASKEVCDVTAVVFNSRPENTGLATLPPGESTFGGNVVTSNIAGTDVAGFGRVFVKGLNQATIFVGTSPQPLPIAVGTWVLDSTLVLPEYNGNFPNEKVPFLDQYDPAAQYLFPQPTGAPHILRPGLVGGHFYKVVDVSPIKAGGPGYYQTITLDRPAKSDGFSVTVLSGVADVITKSVGRMPHR
jgi:prepilin-type N-terminal cleavage/methylation domain-containing protein